MDDIENVRKETFAAENEMPGDVTGGGGSATDDPFAELLVPSTTLGAAEVILPEAAGEAAAVDEAPEAVEKEAAKKTKVGKKGIVALTLGALILGLVVGIFIGGFATKGEEPVAMQDEDGQLPVSEEAKFDRLPDVSKLVVDWDYRRPERVCFTFDEPIAPDYFVGYGSIGSGYAIFEQNPERWDPLGIGTGTALGLMKTLRMEISGLTEDIYAEGHEMTVTIATPHLDRKDEIIEEIKAVAQEYFDGLAEETETKATNGVDEVSC